MSPPFLRLVALADPAAAGAGAAGRIGAKAARLAAAHQAGLPVLPGWVVPVSESRPAVRAGAGAVRSAGRPAGRRAVLSRPVGPALATELRAAVQRLGGRVIVRSSSPLEAGTRWAGAFSSVAEVGPDDVTVAVRSCWAAAFAVDPLARLDSCGLPLEALELGLLIQPELRPEAGGVARVAGEMVTVEGVAGHPAALLSGWAEGAQARFRLRPGPAGPALAGDAGLTALLGGCRAAAVAGLAGQVHRALGDDLIEWAAAGRSVWLLQSARQTVPPHRPGAAGPATERPGRPAAPAGEGDGAGDLMAREWMPLLAAIAQARGRHVPASPAVPGTAAGRLVACRPHEQRAAAARDAILLIGRPVPALAPLLFGARGVIARTGAAGSHLAEVARSLGVPMVTGCRAGTVLDQDSSGREWIAAVDGTAGDVALLPALALSGAEREEQGVRRRPQPCHPR